MRLRILLMTSFVLLGSSALAYTLLPNSGEVKRWPNARATIYHDPQWSQTPTLISELQNAMSEWSSVPGSNFVFTAGGASPSVDLRSRFNGNSDCYFDSLPANLLAVTGAIHSQSVIFDHDVTFNSNWAWDTHGANNPGGNPDFRTVAIHEFGHVLGLDHDDTFVAVMNRFIEPGEPHRALEFDDQEGCRFLYPSPDPGPAPASDADLALLLISFTPEDAGSGDEIDVEYIFTNVGEDDSSPFIATFYLVDGTSVQPTDRFLGSRSHGAASVEEQRTGSVTLLLPNLPDPTLYRIGVILDAVGATGDQHLNNNSGVTTGVIRGGGDAVPVAPGHLVRGDFFPFGRESFSLDLLAGTKLKLDARIDDGSVAMQVIRQETGEVLLERSRFGRVKRRVKIREDGIYIVNIDSRRPEVTGYTFRVGAKPIRIDGSVDIGAAAQVFLPGYRGSRVQVQVRSRSDVRPTVEVTGIEADARSTRGGRRVRVPRSRFEDDGPLVLVLSNAEGPSGLADYRVKMRFPKDAFILDR